MSIEIALSELKKWSGTFYEPIKLLPDKLKKTTTAFYLMLRAIDEIEDHEKLSIHEKKYLLGNLSRALQSNDKNIIKDKIILLFDDYKNKLNPTTLNLPVWVDLLPDDIAPRIFDGCSTMANRMIFWVENNWAIKSEHDLNEYFFVVAGSPGLVLADISLWYENKHTNRIDAVGFGNFMQAINILRGRKDDLKRGVDFFPNNWTEKDVINYALIQKKFADSFTNSLQSGVIYDSCCLLLNIANYGLTMLTKGETLNWDSDRKP